MKVGKLTIVQKNKLVNKEFAPDSFYNPIQDINNKWIVSIEEMEQSTGEFEWVQNLPLIDYIPKEEII
jgi:hypothetical protein